MADDSMGSGPTGIPDPNNPGYDTAGYPLAAVAGPITGNQWAPGTPQASGVTPSFTPSAPYTPPSNSIGQVWSAGGPSGNFDATGAPMSFDTNIGDTGGGLVDPFTQAAPSYLHAPNFTPPAFTKPDPFTLPSGQDVLNEDPSYGFRLQQGEQALQNSAAQGGVLNTGNTLKAILGYGQNFASQEFGNAVNRRKMLYDTNYQTQNVDPYKFSYQAAMDSFMPKFADWSAANSFDWNNYLKSYDIFRNRQLDTVAANNQLS
jgi:hypothetical protein